MSDANSPEEGYQCSKCGVAGEWNDDCIQCQVNMHVERNKDAYIKMGKL